MATDELESTTGNEFNRIVTNACQQYKNIRFTVYRTALKLRLLQHLLCLEKVDLPTTLSAISQFGLTTGHNVSARANADSSSLSYHELDILIKHVMKDTITKQNEIDNPLISKCITDFIYAVYELSSSCDHVTLARIKCFFIVFCNKCLANKYRALFWNYCESGGHLISQDRLFLMLRDCVQITSVVNEKQQFQNVQPAVDLCMAGEFNASVDEERFIKWMLKEPMNIVWLPTMHRLTVSEKTKHNIKCKLCKTQPFVGLRFQCLRCIGYNVCQMCYLTRRDHKPFHKEKHPILEHCISSTKGQSMRSFGRTFRNIITKRYKKKNNGQGMLGENLPELNSTLAVQEEREQSVAGSSSDGRLSVIEEEESQRTNVKQIAKDYQEEPVIRAVVPLKESNPHRVPTQIHPEIAQHVAEIAMENHHHGSYTDEYEEDIDKEKQDLLDIIHNLSDEKEKMSRVTEVLANSTEQAALLSARNEEESEMLKAQIDVLQEHNKSLLTEVQVLRSYVDIQQQTLNQSIAPQPVNPIPAQGDVSMVSPLVRAHSFGDSLDGDGKFSPAFMAELEAKMRKILNSETVSNNSRSLLMDISENTRKLLNVNLGLSPSESPPKDRAGLNKEARNEVPAIVPHPNQQSFKRNVTSAKDVHVKFLPEREKESEGIKIQSLHGRESDSSFLSTSSSSSLDGDSEINVCDLHAYKGPDTTSASKGGMNLKIANQIRNSKAERKILELAEAVEDANRF